MHVYINIYIYIILIDLFNYIMYIQPCLMIMVVNNLCDHGDISEDHGSAGNTFDDGDTGGGDDDIS